MQAVTHRITKYIQSSSQDLPRQVFTFERYMKNLLFNTIYITPLMAQPYELIYISNVNTQIKVEPPEKPHG